MPLQTVSTTIGYPSFVVFFPPLTQLFLLSQHIFFSIPSFGFSLIPFPFLFLSSCSSICSQNSFFCSTFSPLRAQFLAQLFCSVLVLFAFEILKGACRGRIQSRLHFLVFISSPISVFLSVVEGFHFSLITSVSCIVALPWIWLLVKS